MSWTIILILIVAGMIFLLLEVLVIPGSTVVGVVGFILIAVGVWQSYAVYGTPAGHYVLAGTLALTVLLLGFSLRSKTWSRVMLHAEVDGRANVIEKNTVKVGDRGVTVSRLAPSGKIMINDKFYEAKTMGEFIDQQTDVKVIKIAHNQIFVQIIN